MSNEVSIKVSQKTAGKIGLFGAMSVIIGGIIGIGIFFKNNGVFGNNHGNATGILLSWSIAIVIGLATAYSYGEIVSVKDKSANTGLGGWSNKFVGNGMGRIIKITQPLIYYSLYVLVCSVFAAEAILNVFSKDPGSIDSSIKMWMVMLIALGIVVVFMGTNAFIGRANKKFSQITSPIKFIPLIMVIGLGIIFGSLHPDHNLFTDPGNIYGGTTDTNPGSFDINGVFMSLPPILFALDSFLIVGNIAGDVKEPQKNVPLSIILSMALSGFVYILVTVGQIFTGCGNAYDLINFIFTNGQGGAPAENVKIWATVCSAIISVFILIAILGVVNSLCMACVKSTNASINEVVIIGSDKLVHISKGRENLPGLIASGIMIMFFWLAIGIPSMWLNTDQFMDGTSNMVVLFYFALYGVIAIYSAINRKTKKVTGILKSKGQVPIALIGGVGCIAIALYAMGYTNLTSVVLHPEKENKSWGLFLDNTTILKEWQSAITFWTFGLFFIALPFINDLLIKHFKPWYNQPLLWEKTK